MGTYNLPRNVKGEGRILFVFSTKALIYTVVGIGIGFIFYLIFSCVKFLFKVKLFFSTSQYFYIKIASNIKS